MTEPKETAIPNKFELPDAPPVTDVDTQAINSGPAFFSNKLYATIMPQGLRITFAELNPASSTPAYRTAVFLAFQDAAALVDLLQRQLALLGSLQTEDLVKVRGEDA